MLHSPGLCLARSPLTNTAGRGRDQARAFPHSIRHTAANLQHLIVHLPVLLCTTRAAIGTGDGGFHSPLHNVRKKTSFRVKPDAARAGAGWAPEESG
jgi:hypothetical protein